MPFAHSSDAGQTASLRKVIGFRFMRSMLGWVVVGWVICCQAFSQQAAQTKERPTVTFTCDFPGSEPDHYFLSIASDGAASYDSTGKLTKDSEDGDPYRFDFVASEATRERVFDLAKKAGYFEGKIDSGNKKLAPMGMKTLTYTDLQRSTHTVYNYSPVPAVEELTRLFQGMAMTLEFKRRLEYEYHYQKLALDEELKRMEEMKQAGSLTEIAAVVPILQKIANDPALINVARTRAQRLMNGN